MELERWLRCFGFYWLLYADGVCIPTQTPGSYIHIAQTPGSCIHVVYDLQSDSWNLYAYSTCILTQILGSCIHIVHVSSLRLLDPVYI